MRGKLESPLKADQDSRGEKEFKTKTTIKPVISRIRYFDTSLLDTDSIIVKVTHSLAHVLGCLLSRHMSPAMGQNFLCAPFAP